MFLKIRTWNVRTLRGPGKGEQIAMEMGRYELDILSVTETHIPGSGTLILHEEKGTTMVFSGRWSNDRGGRPCNQPKSKKYPEITASCIFKVTYSRVLDSIVRMLQQKTVIHWKRHLL